MDCLTDDYPLVGVNPDARIPPRSVLASLRPMGLGTPYRESLSSFYLELAHIHHLSPRTLAKEILVPRIKVGNERRDKDNFILWKLPLFNGIGTVPETWAQHLDDLTGRDDLVDLTLVTLRPYTNMQRLMSGTKRWCPLCLSDSAQTGRVYGQLLWEIAAVEACPKHGIKLVSQCGCNRSAPLLARNAIYLSGICESCGHSLAQNYEGLIKLASEDEMKRAQLVAELLGGMDRLKHNIDRAAGIPMFIKNAVRHFTGGNAALFGRLLGIKKNTLHGWTHGEFVPTFPEIVEIAFACRCSIADILLGAKVTFDKPELVNTQSITSKPFRTKETQTLDRDLVTHQLEMLLNETLPVSVAEAATRIGVNRRTLFRDFGNIAQKISQRFREHRHSEKIRKFADRCDLYHQSAVRLMLKGIRPTPRLVGLDIRGKRIIIKGYERTVCSKICKEVIQTSSFQPDFVIRFPAGTNLPVRAIASKSSRSVGPNRLSRTCL